MDSKERNASSGRKPLLCTHSQLGWETKTIDPEAKEGRRQKRERSRAHFSGWHAKKSLFPFFFNSNRLFPLLAAILRISNHLDPTCVHGYSGVTDLFPSSQIEARREMLFPDRGTMRRAGSHVENGENLYGCNWGDEILAHSIPTPRKFSERAFFVRLSLFAFSRNLAPLNTFIALPLAQLFCPIPIWQQKKELFVSHTREPGEKKS